MGNKLKNNPNIRFERDKVGFLPPESTGGLEWAYHHLGSDIKLPYEPSQDPEKCMLFVKYACKELDFEKRNNAVSDHD